MVETAVPPVVSDRGSESGRVRSAAEAGAKCEGSGCCRTLPTPFKDVTMVGSGSSKCSWLSAGVTKCEGGVWYRGTAGLARSSLALEGFSDKEW